MKNLALQLHEYFYNTRTERNASIALLLMSTTFFALPLFYPFLFPSEPPNDFSEFKETIIVATPDRAIAEKSQPKYQPNFRSNKSKAIPVELFKFDPNKVAKDELVRLGLSARTAQTLLNFRSKGGQFFKKEDLKKVYGLRSEDYERLKDWIVLEKKSQTYAAKEEVTKPTAVAVSEEVMEAPKPVYKKKEYVPVSIDINKATAEEWQQLRGIGPGYSKRIVKFRDYLGGFTSSAQVAQTYGLPDSTFQMIKPYLIESPVLKKIAVNKYNLDELKKHPYILSLIHI